MLYHLNKRIISVYHLGVPKLFVYHNGKLVWLSSNSSFGRGYWDNDYPWNNDEGWNNG